MNTCHRRVPTRFTGRLRALIYLAVVGLVMAGLWTGPGHAPWTPTPAFAGTTPILVTVDGIRLSVSSPFTPASAFVASPPDSAIRSATIFRANPFGELAITAIPYGSRDASESALPPATAGGAATYLAALTKFRTAQGAVAVAPAPSIQIFGLRSSGITSTVDLPSAANNIQPTTVYEWTAEGGNRVWIVRASRVNADMASETSFSPTQLGQIIISSTDLASTSAGAPPTPTAPGTAPQTPIATNTAQSSANTVAPMPPWWNGSQCDGANYLRQSGHTSYTLQANYQGVVVCAPRPAYVADNPPPVDPLETFPVGAGAYEWQCVELSLRFMYQIYGVTPYLGNGSEMVSNYRSAYGGGLVTIANGTVGLVPLPGDILSFGSTSTFGHTAVVTSSAVNTSGNGSITYMEENGSSSGWELNIAVSGWTLLASPSVAAWLHSPTVLGSDPNPTPPGGYQWALANSDGRLEIFAPNTTAMYHKWETSPNASTSYVDWQSVPGDIAGNYPVAALNSDGRGEVFWRATNGALWHSYWWPADTSWHSEFLGNWILEAPAVARNSDGRLQLFYRTSNGIAYRVQNAPSSWFSPEVVLGGVPVAGITANQNANGTLEIFYPASNGLVGHNWQLTAGSASFGGEYLAWATSSHKVAVGRNVDGRLDLFWTDSNSTIMRASQVGPNQYFANPVSTGGATNAAMSTGRNADGRVEIFVQGTNSSTFHLYQTIGNPGSWAGSAWEAMSPPFLSGGPPSVAVNADGRIELFERSDGDGSIQHTWQSSANRPFGSWVSLNPWLQPFS